MEDTAKYLIHADLVADSVVERSDVVGAVYGQTEGLLGDELELRDLQDSSKIGRIDVSVESENGRSFGHITVASNLDRVETALLAAALESIERVGPCRADVEIARIEDVRAAKRREVVDRAKELLATSFGGGVLESDDIVEEVRESVRVDDIDEYEGLPAGPNVPESEAVVVVEGRADVQRLLRYGVKNAVAVEGVDVPEPVADLTRERTTTAFFDGDRGGDLILRELAQVGDVDYVAVPPEGESVEDLDHAAIDTALREKTPFTPALLADPDADEADGTADAGDAETDVEAPAEATEDTAATDGSTRPAPESSTGDGAGAGTEPVPPSGEEGAAGTRPLTVGDHVDALEDSGKARLLDDGGEIVAEIPVEEAFDALEEATDAPATVVLDGAVDQRLLDVAAQRGVPRIVGAETDDVVKQPASVRVLTPDRF